MIPEAAIAMLASARIGAVHTVVFAGFSANALKTRIEDANCKLIITANEGIRGNKTISLKANVDEALLHDKNKRKVLVIQHTSNETAMQANRDTWYHEAVKTVKATCPCEMM